MSCTFAKCTGSFKSTAWRPRPKCVMYISHTTKPVVKSYIKQATSELAATIYILDNSRLTDQSQHDPPVIRLDGNSAQTPRNETQSDRPNGRWQAYGYRSNNIWDSRIAEMGFLVANVRSDCRARLIHDG